jgi:hypothetical protein
MIAFSLLDKGVLYVSKDMISEFYNVLFENQLWRLRCATGSDHYVSPFVRNPFDDLFAFDRTSKYDLYLSENMGARRTSNAYRLAIDFDLKCSSKESSIAFTRLDGPDDFFAKVIWRILSVVHETVCAIDGDRRHSPSVIVSKPVSIHEPKPIYNAEFDVVAYKTGVHLHFPEIFMTTSDQKELRQHIVAVLNAAEEFCPNVLRMRGVICEEDGWKNIIDNGITALRVNGCYKMGKCECVINDGFPKFHHQSVFSDCANKDARHRAEACQQFSFYWWHSWLYLPNRVFDQELMPNATLYPGNATERSMIAVHDDIELLKSHQVYKLTTLNVPDTAANSKIRGTRKRKTKALANRQNPLARDDLSEASSRNSKSLRFEDTMDSVVSSESDPYVASMNFSQNYSISNNEHPLFVIMDDMIKTVIFRKSRRTFDLSAHVFTALDLTSRQINGKVCVKMSSTFESPTKFSALDSMFNEVIAKTVNPPDLSEQMLQKITVDFQQLTREIVVTCMGTRVPSRFFQESIVWRVISMNDVSFVSLHCDNSKSTLGRTCIVSGRGSKVHEENNTHFTIALPLLADARGVCLDDSGQSQIEALDGLAKIVQSIVPNILHRYLTSVPFTDVWLMWFGNSVIRNTISNDFPYWCAYYTCWKCTTSYSCLRLDWPLLAPVVVSLIREIIAFNNRPTLRYLENDDKFAIFIDDNVYSFP